MAISLDTAQSLGLSALDMRQGVGALSAPSTGSSFGNISGVFPGGTSGAGLSNDVLVYSDSGMTSSVNGGHWAVARSTSVYLGMVTGTVTVTHGTANPSNPRIDYVILRVRDPGVDPATVTKSAEITILPGTPGAVPVEPSAQLTDGDMVLSAVTVRAGATSTTAGDYSDRRLFVVARGGIGLKSDADTRPGAYEGSYRDNWGTNGLERWSGTAWQQVASPAAWTAFTPKLFSAAGQCNLGSSGTAKGYYCVNGKIMHLRYAFRAARPCNLGYGAIYTQLPTNIVSAPTEESHIYAKINTIDGSSIFAGEVFIRPNDVRMDFYFPISPSDCRIAYYRVSNTQGTANQGVPYVAGFPDPFILICQGTIEVS